ncbi:MAG: hypothetical protein AB7T48_04665 [Solirubrobacterales bacterium]
MSTATTIAALAVALPLLWLLGGMILRLAGLLLFLAAAATLALGSNAGGACLAGAFGALLWLAGHWLFALRHQQFKSPLARHLFARLPGPFDPTRSWAVGVADPRRERDRRRT